MESPLNPAIPRALLCAKGENRGTKGAGAGRYGGALGRTNGMVRTR